MVLPIYSQIGRQIPQTTTSRLKKKDLLNMAPHPPHKNHCLKHHIANPPALITVVSKTNESFMHNFVPRKVCCKIHSPSPIVHCFSLSSSAATYTLDWPTCHVIANGPTMVKPIGTKNPQHFLANIVSPMTTLELNQMFFVAAFNFETKLLFALAFFPRFLEALHGQCASIFYITKYRLGGNITTPTT